MSVEAHGQFLGTAAQVIPVLYLAALVDFGRPVDAATANGETESDSQPQHRRRPKRRATQALRSLFRISQILITPPFIVWVILLAPIPIRVLLVF